MTEQIGASPVRRKAAIMEMLKKDDEVKVSKLAEAFGISGVTIRGDLSEMEQAGLLRRTHGGAVSTRKAYYNMSLSDRMKVNRNEKIRIAKTCAALIKDGDTLMIDSGTTTRYLAMELAERDSLTIVTNAMLIAEEFVYNNSVNVILLGGNMDLKYQYTYGNDTIAQLSKYRADKAVIAADGFSVDHGLTTYHHQEADVSRCMIERANSVIAIADHSKIGKEGFARIASFKSVDTLVTDGHPGIISELERFRRMGTAVEEAGE